MVGRLAMSNPLAWRSLNRFQAAIRKYGVPDEEIFQTADLFERRNIAQVTLGIFALARIVSSLLHPLRSVRFSGANLQDNCLAAADSQI